MIEDDVDSLMRQHLSLQYQKGQLYMIAKASREETNGSEGIEVLVNERFTGEFGPGIYTHKVIHLSQYDPH